MMNCQSDSLEQLLMHLKKMVSILKHVLFRHTFCKFHVFLEMTIGSYRIGPDRYHSLDSGKILTVVQSQQSTHYRSPKRMKNKY